MTVNNNTDVRLTLAPAQRTPTQGASWQPTNAHYRASVVAIMLAAIAVIWRRPDLLVLAMPMAVVCGWSLLTRPRQEPTVDDRLGHGTIREGDATRWIVQFDKVAGTDIVSATLSDTPWYQRRPLHGSVAQIATDDSIELSIDLRSTRWGRRSIEPGHVVVTSDWGAFRWAETTAPHPLVTLPVGAPFDTSAPMRPTNGLVGLYRSVQRGDGSEFAGTRRFQSGDRMRRINWPRSLRSDGLHVNATWDDQDSHVSLLIDASHDYGVSEGIDGAASSLDTALRAASAIAGHYSTHGDRVSLRVIGSIGSRQIPPGTGPAHLRRVLDSLTRIRPSPARLGSPDAYRTERAMGNGQLTVMLSPLVAPEALARAVSLGRQGVAVVVVDTLPDHITADDDPVTSLAWRIRLLERRRELRRVQEVGIPVVRWDGAGSLDVFLRDVTRRASAPRLFR